MSLSLMAGRRVVSSKHLVLNFEKNSTSQNGAWQSFVTILHTRDWKMLK